MRRHAAACGGGRGQTGGAGRGGREIGATGGRRQAVSAGYGTGGRGAVIEALLQGAGGDASAGTGRQVGQGA